jgi:hypothetical protein
MIAMPIGAGLVGEYDPISIVVNLTLKGITVATSHKILLNVSKLEVLQSSEIISDMGLSIVAKSTIGIIQ